MQFGEGLTTIAGSWIGGGANQAAMKEIFQASDDDFFSDDYSRRNCWKYLDGLSSDSVRRKVSIKLT